MVAPELANGDAGLPEPLGPGNSLVLGEHPPSGEAGGPRDDAANEHLAFLDGLLENIAKLDYDLFFQEPVKEEDAPRYFEIIKRPMDFGTMRQKVRLSRPFHARFLSPCKTPVSKIQH